MGKNKLLDKENDNSSIPVVSICCITYNQDKYIVQAIEGFLSQKTTFPVEIIIYDDASTDKTAEIIKGYCKKYPNTFVPLIQTENQYSKGLSPSATFTWPKAKGKYIAVCEGDDYWIDQYKLQKQVDFLEKNNNCSECFTNAFNYYPGTGKKLDYLREHFNAPIKSFYSTEDLIKDNFIPTASLMFRNILQLEDYKIISNAPMMRDWVLHLLLTHLGTIGYIDEITSVRRVHPGGIISMKPRNIVLEYRIQNYEFINKLLDFKYDGQIKGYIESHKVDINKFLSDNNIGIKLNHCITTNDASNKEDFCLAIFTPVVGVVSETFISNHIKYLAPGRTIIFTSQIKNTFDTSNNVICLPGAFDKDNLSEETKRDIIRLLIELKVTHILMEYGCEGKGIVELNYFKMHLPLYVHFHGYDASSMLEHSAIVEYYKWMSGFVTGIITVSNKMKTRLAAAGITKEKMVVIHYGVNIHHQRTSVPPEPPVKLIAVSRLVAKKGIIFLLQAFLKAKQVAPNIILNIIGDGPLRPEIEEFLSTNNLDNSVSLLGALPHEIVKKMMNDSHIFIQHSITDPVTGDAEGLPNTILEASAAGLPIISTFHEGIPDAVDHEKTGLLVQEFDVDKMAEYIATLSLNSSLREKMGALGRDKMTNDFHLKGQIQKLQSLMGLPKGEFSDKFDEPILENIPTEPIAPFISICIPTYNRTNYLGETIQHVLNQTYTNYEIVVVDDGSTEDTEAIINKFNDERIRFIRKAHTNAADTRNRCIDESRGEFILWQDDDDYPDPELLAEYVKTLNLLPDLDIVYSYHRVHGVGLDKTWLRRYDDWYFNRSKLAESLLCGPQFMFCGGLYKKSIYNQIGKFNIKFIRAHDYELAFRIALNENIKLKLVPKMLYNYREFEHGTLSGSLKDKDCRYEWAILNKVLSLDYFKMRYSEDKLGVVQSAAFYFILARRYSQLNCIPKTIEFLEKSIALKDDDKAISFLSETRSMLTKLLQKRKEVLSYLKKDKNNKELNSYLGIIDKFINPFNQNKFFPENDESVKGYSSSTNNNNYSNQTDHRTLNQTSDVETANKLICNIPLTFNKQVEPNKTKLKIIAIISSYNEGDIIHHVIGNLIANGILVYLIDNNSTDNTYEQASYWLGKGLLHIEKFPDDCGYPIRSKNEYVWGDILKRKEELAYQLNADWFIHADADEFRESPFPGTNLAEGITIVDNWGYNAINFELFNFRPTDNSFNEGDDVRKYLKHFEHGQWFDRNQIKAWKKQPQKINLVSSGGHIVQFPERKIFPVPFILRHYPFRSDIQGKRKVFKDRLPRFSKEEKAIGWHVQYDTISKNDETFLYNADELTEYDEIKVKTALLIRALRRLVLSQIHFSESINLGENCDQQRKDDLSIIRYIMDKYPEYIRGDHSIVFLDLLNKIKEEENIVLNTLYDSRQEERIVRKQKDYSISVIIPVFNKIQFTINCLESISKVYNRENNFEVIVVDNASSDGTKEYLQFAEIIYPNLRVISNTKNIGFAKANNQAVKEAGGDYVLFLNNDTEVQNGWLDKLILIIENDNSVGAVGCKLLYPDGNIQHAGVVIMEDKASPEAPLIAYHVYYKDPANLPEANQLRTYQSLTAACLLVRKSAFGSVDGFDEEYWNGYEDVDLCFKLGQDGWKLVYQPTSVVFHYESKSGPERFSKVSQNTERLNKKWTHKIKPDFEVGEDGKITNANTFQVKEYVHPGIKEVRPKQSRTFDISIIVLTYNGLRYTKEFLNSIDEHTRGSYEVIIVDNASTDGTIDFLKESQKKHDNYKLILNNENLGFPKAVNQAIKISTGKYYLITNNDIVVTKGWLERMVRVAESDPLVGIVGPISNSVSGVQLDKNASYKNISELPVYAAKIREQNANQSMEFPRVAFLCTLIKREVIEKLGGLDERFSPGNFEDDDFCLRAQLAGYKTIIAKDVFIHHYGSKSFTANGIEKYAERLRINEGIFVNKWGANPDEIWIKGKEFKKRNYRFPLNINPAKEKYERALIYIEEKEYEEALANLNEAIESFSEILVMNIRFDQLLNLSGNVALVLNNSEAAKSYFEKELNFSPNSTSACKGLADTFFIKEEFEAAKSMYEWAIKNDPDNLKAVNRLREVNQLLGLNDSHNSLATTKKVSEFDNLFLEAYNLYESSDYKMAMVKVTEAVKHFIPNETMISKEDLYILIGNICLSLNELESSKAAFETALENNPQSSEACFGLGMIFYQSSQLNEAKIMFEWAVNNNPDNQPAISALNELNVAINGNMEIAVEN